MLSLWLQLASLLLFILSAISFVPRQSQVTIISIPHKADMIFVKDFTPTDFQAQKITPLILPYFNRLVIKTQKDEWKWRNLHCWQKKFTLTPAVTNFTSAIKLYYCNDVIFVFLFAYNHDTIFVITIYKTGNSGLHFGLRVLPSTLNWRRVSIVELYGLCLSCGWHKMHWSS